MDALLDFTDKVAVITGAAQGFGKLLAEQLAQRGAKLVISDVNQAAVQQVAEQIALSGAEVIAIQCDVAQNLQCKALVDTAISHYQKVDIAVNNAGIAHDYSPLHQLDEGVLDQQFAVNVKGVQFGMSHQIEQMLQQGGGTVLNVSSMAGLGGAAMVGAYAMAKHAVLGLTKTAAIEYAKYNIRVNAVCPFFSYTKMVTDMADGDTLAKLSKTTPMRRLAEPEEIVTVMLMMISPGNTYMTGQCVAIDGGFSAS